MLPRVLAVLAAAAAGLVGAVAANAAPTLVVESGPALGDRAVARFELHSPEGIDELTLLVPAGYGVDLSGAVGEPLGAAAGAVRAGGVEIELDGSVSVAGTPAPEGCSDTPAGALWRLSLSGVGVGLGLLFAVAPAGLDTGSSYRLTLCTAIPAGLELVRLSFALDDIVTTPGQAGRYAWRALVTAVGAAQAVEARSVSPLPAVLTLDGTYSRVRGAARLKGKLTAAGVPVADASVAILSGPSASSLRPTLRTRTGARGGFDVFRKIESPTVFRAASARLVLTGGACGEPIAPGGCASETVVVAGATSHTARVTIPPPPVLRLGSRGPAVTQLQRRLAALHYLPAGSADGYFGSRTWHAVVAFQGWTRLPRTGVVDRRTWTTLGQAGIPRPWGGLRYGVEIDLARQVLLLVRGGLTVRAIHVSTGAGGRTPSGHFSVRSKALMSWSVPFQVWMPYAQYFYGGFAMHSYPDVPAYPASHGCVRLPSMEAPVVYAFTTIGTPVWIR